MNKKNVTAVAIALVLGLFFGFLIGQYFTISAPSTVVEQGTASIMLDYGGGLVKTYRGIEVKNTATLLALTEALARENNLEFEKREYKGLGTLIEKIGNKKNGTDESYWQYWVNNVSVQVGAGDYQVKPGDVIEWKFIPYVGVQ